MTYINGMSFCNHILLQPFAHIRSLSEFLRLIEGFPHQGSHRRGFAGSALIQQHQAPAAPWQAFIHGLMGNPRGIWEDHGKYIGNIWEILDMWMFLWKISICR